MQAQDLIAVTGAAGFIGSYLTGFLNRHGFDNLVLVDRFGRDDRDDNLRTKNYVAKVDRDEFAAWAQDKDIKAVFHLGARTDTTEMDYEIHRRLNLEYSKAIWEYCAARSVPLVYASSAATYGDGVFGFRDEHGLSEQLQPLNPYGVSKNEFDIWALRQPQQPPFWAGLKFFNVYGPNEYHKGRMASVVYHAYRQIIESGSVKLFRSHNPQYADGGQLRDFIYVDDVASICFWLMQHTPQSGIYNTGSGTARSFNDLVGAIYATLGRPASIDYIDTPHDIRDKYQYFTEADMSKLRAAGYEKPFHSLEQGVREYVSQFLSGNRYY